MCPELLLLNAPQQVAARRMLDMAGVAYREHKPLVQDVALRLTKA